MATGLSHLPPTPSFSTPLFIPCLLPLLRLSTRDLALCQRVPTRGAKSPAALAPHFLASFARFLCLDGFLSLPLSVCLAFSLLCLSPADSPVLCTFLSLSCLSLTYLSLVSPSPFSLSPSPHVPIPSILPHTCPTLLQLHHLLLAVL